MTFTILSISAAIGLFINLIWYAINHMWQAELRSREAQIPGLRSAVSYHSDNPLEDQFYVDLLRRQLHMMSAHQRDVTTLALYAELLIVRRRLSLMEKTLDRAALSEAEAGSPR